MLVCVALIMLSGLTLSWSGGLSFSGEFVVLLVLNVLVCLIILACLVCSSLMDS